MSRLPAALSRLRFNELALFVQVAQAGSITAAARRLGLPKSTVGRAISRIEEDLGIALVRRMTQGPALTEQGRTLAEQAAPHVGALRDLAAGLRREGSEAYGTLRISAPPDLGTTVLAPLLPGFLARHPRLCIDLDNSLRMVDVVAEGFDLAIRVITGRLPSSALVARKLARVELGLYASPTYLARRDAPRRPDALAQHDHVLFQSRAPSPPMLEGPGGKVKLAVTARVGVNDFLFVREAIVQGAGIGPLPWYVANAEVTAGRLVRVLPEYRVAGTVAYLVHPPLRPLPAKLQVFRSFLLEQAPRLLVDPSLLKDNDPPRRR